LKRAAATCLSTPATRKRPAAVVHAEIYSDARVREFEEADRSTAAENARVAKVLRPRRR